MKFGFSQLFKRTPKALSNLGHGLIAGSAAISISSFEHFPKLAISVQLAGAIGYLLVNMFSESDDKNV